MGRIIYDLTLELSPELLVYPGDPAVEIKELLSIERGDIVNLSAITTCLHAGTHIDAPRHFLAGGATVPELSLEHFIGKAKIFAIEGKDAVEVDDLQKFDIKRNDRVLLKTKNSALLSRPEFTRDYTYLSPEAAIYLADLGIQTLGFDYLTIDKFDGQDFGAHYALLRKNIAIIEGLNLRGIEPGEYQLIAMPLKVKGGNGSPVRAVLIKES
ncbi:MAG: cyclase family protein [Bacillota bacterium]